MIFKKSLVGNSRAAQEQWDAVNLTRKMVRQSEEVHANSLRKNGERLLANVGLIPRDVSQAFDDASVIEFESDNGDTFLNDLLPLSKSVNIGKLTNRFRQVSDSGVSVTSMSGQVGTLLDQTDSKYDGSIVPVHQVGFSRDWRGQNAGLSEGYDALIDDQRTSLITLRKSIAEQFMSGHKDKDGNIITVDGLKWSGMRADTRVAQVDLGVGGINFNFTDSTKTGEEIKAAFAQVRDVLWITNNCEQEVTYYISKAIASNFERKFSPQYDAAKMIDELAGLMGVAAIKVTNKLVGNELMGFTLDGNVRPIVGMAINTVQLQRPKYNSNFEFEVWGAIGFEVRTSFSAKTCAVMAQ